MTNAAQEQYGSPAGSIQLQVDQPPQPVQAQDSLPFTGLDIVLLVGTALVLGVAGAALRRLTQPA